MSPTTPPPLPNAPSSQPWTHLSDADLPGDSASVISAEELDAETGGVPERDPWEIPTDPAELYYARVSGRSTRVLPHDPVTLITKQPIDLTTETTHKPVGAGGGNTADHDGISSDQPPARSQPDTPVTSAKGAVTTPPLGIFTTSEHDLVTTADSSAHVIRQLVRPAPATPPMEPDPANRALGLRPAVAAVAGSAAEVRPAGLAGVPPQRAPRGGIDRGRVPWAMVAAGVALGVALVGAGMLITRTTSDLAPQNSAATRPTATSAGAIPAQRITAVASSTQNSQNGVTYAAANTLDGALNTAWNSDGKPTDLWLNYEFDQKVELHSITFRNGYQKTLGGSDLFTLNSRARTITITTDGGTWTRDLTDTKDPQTLTENYGSTSSVKITITSTYPGTKYADVALSEVGFKE